MLLYHERQVAALCGQHCLNNLLQGPYFSEVDLAEVAQELDRKEQALMFEQGATSEARAFLREGSGNVGLDGNFSIQVLTAALMRAHNVSLEDTRRPEHRPAMEWPAKQEGFVLNRHSHWYCMRRIDGQWWQFNSTQPLPVRLSEASLGSTLAELAADSWTVFLAVGKLPAPMPSSSGLGDPSNWVDPSKPPPGALDGFISKAAPPEPKFQAFSGAGHTLGASSSTASAGEKRSAGAALGTEDEQLAFALSLSAGLAHKERLSKRLPPEPETGAGAARVAVRMSDGTRLARRFGQSEPVQSLIDFVCIELADKPAAANTSGRWMLASQYPPITLAFASDGTADDEAAASRSFSEAGLSPSASLNLKMA